MSYARLSQFGKCKYNKGTIIGRRSAWILGGVCRETGDMFLVQCPGNKRDKPTLEAIIIANVAPGTKIYTDGWAAYRVIPFIICLGLVTECSEFDYEAEPLFFSNLELLVLSGSM